MSELKTLKGSTIPVSGVDVRSEDAITKDNEAEDVILVKELAQQYQAVVLCSGKTDIISDGTVVWLVDNGTGMMQHITGTGCMLNALAGTLLSGNNAVLAAVSAAVVFGISGELAADRSQGPESFQPALLDVLYGVDEAQISAMTRIRFR